MLLELLVWSCHVSSEVKRYGGTCRIGWQIVARATHVTTLNDNYHLS